MSAKTFQTAGNWNIAGNWSPVGAPLAGDEVVIAANCTLDVATPELASLTVNLGMQLDLDGYDLTTSGTIDVNGTLLGGEGTIAITGNGDFDYKDGTFTCETSTVDLQGTGKWRLQDVSSADPVYNLKCAYTGKTTSAVKLNTGTADVKRELRLEGGTLDQAGSNDYFQAVRVQGDIASPLVVAANTVIRTNLTLEPVGTSATCHVSAMSTQGSLTLSSRGNASGTKSFELDGDLSVDKQSGRYDDGLTLLGNSSGCAMDFKTNGHSLTLAARNTSAYALNAAADYNKVSADFGASAVVVTRGNVVFKNRANAAVNFGASGWDVSGNVDFQYDAAGDYNFGSSAWQLAGDFTLDSSSLDVDFGTSTLTFDGVIGQTFEARGKSPYNLTVSNGHDEVLTVPSGFTSGHNLVVSEKGRVAFSAAVTFNDATVSSKGWATFEADLTAVSLTLAGKSRTRFAAGVTATVTTATWQGSWDGPARLESVIRGQGWSLKVSGTQSLQYVSVRDCDASGGSQIAAQSHCYDFGNNVNWSFAPYNVTRYGYDKASQLNRTVDAESGVTYFEYDPNGNRAKVIDPVANPTYFAYDRVNRLTMMKAADFGATYFGYDKVGNRLKEQNPIGKATYYQYDVLNRLKLVIDPLQEAAYYEFDPVGNLTRSQSPENRVGQFAYDEVNRRTVAGYNDGFAAYFGYDEAGNMVRNQWSAGATYFEFDEANRQTKKTDPLAGVFEYVRDGNGNVTRLVYPGGSGTAYYGFDPLNRILQVKSPAGNGTYYAYDADGNRQQILFGNGAKVYFAYDDAERVTSVRHCLAGGSPLAYFDYARDAAGDITRAAREDGAVVYYGYDVTKRLTSEVWRDSGGSQIYGFEWGYDLAGNRAWQRHDSEQAYYYYNAASAITAKQVLGGAATYYAYDLDGNLNEILETGGSAWSFGHAAHGLVDHIVSGSDFAYFGYDGQLQRRWMRTAAGHTYFDWDSALRVLKVRTPSETIVITHGSSPVDGIGTVVEEQHVGGETLYHHVNPQGTTAAITRKSDSGAAAFWKGQANAFGETLAATGTLPSIFWFQGEAWYRIVINGRTFYVSPTRIYDVKDGRFVERDNSTLRGAYEFVDNMPTATTDPNGELVIPLAGAEWVLRKLGLLPPYKPPAPPQAPPAATQQQSRVQPTIEIENGATAAINGEYGLALTDPLIGKTVNKLHKDACEQYAKAIEILKKMTTDEIKRRAASVKKWATLFRLYTKDDFRVMREIMEKSYASGCMKSVTIKVVCKKGKGRTADYWGGVITLYRQFWEPTTDRANGMRDEISHCGGAKDADSELSNKDDAHGDIAIKRAVRILAEMSDQLAKERATK